MSFYEELDEPFKTIIENCSWRLHQWDTDICTGDVMPCEKLVVEGKCDELKRYFKENAK